MFPLGTVLLPSAVLPLHVFEPRYRAMMAALDPDAPEFGVVLIERGSEVGGRDVRSRLGTLARVVERAELPDGRWVLIAVGTSRLDVTEWLPDDPYPRALIVEREEPPWDPAADDDLTRAEAEVRRALAMAAELGESPPAATFDLAGTPGQRLWQLAVLAPLGPADRQRLLATADPAALAALLVAMVNDVNELLAFRLGGG